MNILKTKWLELLRFLIIGPLFLIPAGIILLLGLGLFTQNFRVEAIGLLGYFYIPSTLAIGFMTNLFVGLPVVILLLKLDKLRYRYIILTVLISVLAFTLYFANTFEWSANETMYMFLLSYFNGNIIGVSSLYYSRLYKNA